MKRFFFFTMIAMISLSSCSEKGIAGIDGDVSLEVNGGDGGEDVTYELTTKHVAFSIDKDILIDDHDAILLKNSEEVERHQYLGEFALSHNEVVLKRSIAEKLQQDTIVYNGGFDLAGVAVMTVSSQLQSCDEVYCSENGKTYCHPQFAEQSKDAVPALNLCNPQPDFLVLHTIDGDILNGDVYFDDQKWLAEIIVTDDDIRIVEYSDAKVVSADEVEIIKTIKVNGSVVETSPIRVAYHATLECGELVTTNNLSPLAYGSDSNVNGEMVTINMNIVSFTASVDMPATVTFVDEDEEHTAKVVYNNLYVTSNGDIKVEDNSTENIDILNTAYFKLVCDNIDMAADTKEIRQTLRVYAEFEKEEDGTISFILHEKEDIRFTAPSGISISSGNDDEFVVESLELSSTGRNQGSWKATKTSTVNGVKFTSYERTDLYNYSHGITNTVKVTKNDDFIIVYNGHEYAVKINEVSIAAAAPVAGNVTTDGTYKYRPYTLTYTASRNNTKAEAKTVFTLKKAVVPYTIEGYKLVRADQTDRYDSSRKTWNATPICAWFESLSDKNNTLFVAYDETTGAEIYRENTSGKTLPTMPLAMVYKDNTFIGGYVLIEENSYTYYSIDGKHHTAVSSVSTATSEEIRRSPYRGSGSYSIEDETTSFDLENGSKLILK